MLMESLRLARAPLGDPELCLYLSSYLFNPSVLFFQSNPALHSSGSNSSSSIKKELVSDNKRSLDKLVKDLSELVPNKKARMDSPGSTKSHTPSPAPTSPVL